MKTEFLYLTYVTIFTGLLWVPYILDRIATRGLLDAVGYPENPKPQSRWAQRLLKAHANAVENLVVFAALVLAVWRASRMQRLAAHALSTFGPAWCMPWPIHSRSLGLAR